MARLYREMPLNSIWEGSGNVMCLDVLRAAGKSPDALPAFWTELDRARGLDGRLDRFVGDLKDRVATEGLPEAGGRRLVEAMMLALQGAILVRGGDPLVADLFCASRLGGDHGAAFGTLPASRDLAAIVERATPTLS